MDKKKFESMLILIVPAVVRLITENYSWDEISASNKFYESKVFECLEKAAYLAIDFITFMHLY